MSINQPPRKQPLDPEQKDKQKKDLSFNEEEIKVFDEVTEDLGFDNENQEDLTEVKIPKELDDQEKIDLLNDSKVKTLLTEPNEQPDITDTLDDDDEIPDLTNKAIKELKDDATNARNNLIVWLGSQEKIKLHIGKGMINGKKLWVEKEFWFNSIDKTQELKLKMLLSRSQTLGYKNTITANKDTRILTETEIDFLYKAPIMINVAEFNYAAYEAKIRFGMEWQDFASVDTEEYGMAIAALAWRSVNVPYYKAKQSSSGSNKPSGKN